MTRSGRLQSVIAKRSALIDHEPQYYSTPHDSGIYNLLSFYKCHLPHPLPLLSVVSTAIAVSVTELGIVNLYNPSFHCTTDASSTPISTVQSLIEAMSCA